MEPRNEPNAMPDAITQLALLPSGTLLSMQDLCIVFRHSEESITYAIKHEYLPPPIILFKKRWWLAGKILTYLELRADTALSQLDEHRQATRRKVTQLRRGES